MTVATLSAEPHSWYVPELERLLGRLILDGTMRGTLSDDRHLATYNVATLGENQRGITTTSPERSAGGAPNSPRREAAHPGCDHRRVLKIERTVQVLRASSGDRGAKIHVALTLARRAEALVGQTLPRLPRTCPPCSGDAFIAADDLCPAPDALPYRHQSPHRPGEEVGRELRGGEQASARHRSNTEAIRVSRSRGRVC